MNVNVMNAYTTKRIYTAWLEETVPDYVKHNLEENIKINDGHWYILCYDKYIAQGNQSWEDLLKRLNNYPNFKAQDINARDVLDDDKDFLHPLYKTIFDYMNTNKNEGYQFCTIKEFLISLYVTSNRDTAWIGANCKSVIPISFSSTNGIRYMANNDGTLTSHAIVVDYNNSCTLTTYLFVLDIIELFLKIYNRDLSINYESMLDLSIILILLDGINPIIQFIVTSEKIESPENRASSVFKYFKDLSITREEIERYSNSMEINSMEIRNPYRNSRIFHKQTWNDEILVSDAEWERYFDLHGRDDEFMPQLSKALYRSERHLQEAECNLSDVATIIKRKQHLTKNLHITPVFPYGVKPYQSIRQRELYGCDIERVFKPFILENVKIYLMLFMYRNLSCLSNEVYGPNEVYEMPTLFKKFDESNPNYKLERTQIKLQHILYPRQNRAPTTDLQSPSAEELDQAQLINGY